MSNAKEVAKVKARCRAEKAHIERLEKELRARRGLLAVLELHLSVRDILETCKILEAA